MKILILLLLQLAQAALASDKYCLTNLADLPNAFLRSDNVDGPSGVSAMNQAMLERKIPLTGFPGPHFMRMSIATGDCVLTDIREETKVKFSNENFRVEHSVIPAVWYRAEDGSKNFGLILGETLAHLSRSKPSPESSIDQILNYAADPEHQLLILYVICPSKRDEVCELTIRNRGQWVKDPKTNQPISFKVLARSRRTGPGFRTLPEGDTPQGIYYLWGSVQSKSNGYGGEARIDLDADMLPINANPYETNSFLLEQLVPRFSLSEYWVNEWPLAYKLGRTALRIHGSYVQKESPDYYVTPKTHLAFLLTAGCISAGSQMGALLNLLEPLGYLGKLHGVGLPNGAKFWKVAPEIGKAFLVVRDR